MNNLLKVENCDSLVRDISTGAILNNDSSGYQAYLSKRERIRQQKMTIDKHDKDINIIKEEISDIKRLLIDLLEMNKNKEEK